MMHTKLIEDKVRREHSSIVEWVYSVLVRLLLQGVSRIIEQKTVSMLAIIYISGKYGVE